MINSTTIESIFDGDADNFGRFKCENKLVFDATWKAARNCGKPYADADDMAFDAGLRHATNYCLGVNEANYRSFLESVYN